MQSKLEQYGVKRFEKKLENGSKLVLLQKPKAPIFVRASFIAGSRFDEEGKDGTAHFLEHMLVAGSKRFPTKDKLSEYIEHFGGELGATTSGEVLNVNVSIAESEDIRVAFELLHEMLLEPLFDKNTFKTEKGAIQKELSGKVSSPDKMLWELYPYLFFQSSSMGRSILGTKNSIASITIDDVKDFYRKYIVSNRLTLIASGDIEMNEISEFANEYLDFESGDSYHNKNEFTLPLQNRTPIMNEIYKGKDQVHFMLGFRISSQDSIENMALGLIADAIGGGRSSVLTKKLRYQKGLVYSLWSSVIDYSDIAISFFKSSTTQEDLQKVLDIVSDEYKRIKKFGLSEKEIESTRNKIVKSLKVKLQTSYDWVNLYTNWERGVGAPIGLDEYVDTIKKITPEITKTVAEKYFTPDNWYLSLCGDVTPEDVNISI